MRAICVFTLVLALGAGLRAQSRLDITIVEGDRATNSLAYGIAKPIVVEVKDQSGKPVEKAAVTAILPALGTGGHFGGNIVTGQFAGDTVATKHTDEHGRVAFRNIHLRELEGEFPIRIVAAHQNLSASVTATQTNARVAAPPKARSSRRKLTILAIAGAGAAAGLVAAFHNGEENETRPAVFNTTPGMPVFTGPR